MTIEEIEARKKELYKEIDDLEAQGFRLSLGVEIGDKLENEGGDLFEVTGFSNSIMFQLGIIGRLTTTKTLSNLDGFSKVSPANITKS